LTSLDVSGAQRTDSGLWFVTVTDAGLEPIASLKRLEELNLGGTKITDLGLAKLKGLIELRSLDLSRTQVTGKGLENLAGLSKLTSLSLWKASRIGDDALPYLSALKNLKFLDVTETKITAPISR
jgi:internalin A